MNTNTRLILIVEDVSSVRENIKRLLEKNPQYRVIAVAFGREAVTLILNKRPDLVIVDLGLPDISGHEVIRQIRLGGYKRNVIILTANKEASSIVQHIGHDAEDYLTKPFENDVLLAYVKKNLQQTFSTTDQIIQLGKYTFDTFHNTISGECFKTFDLKPVGSKILEALARSKHTFMRDEVLRDEVYNGDSDIEVETLRRNVDRLNLIFRADGQDNIISYHPERKLYELLVR